MNPEEEADRAQHELRRQLTAAWVMTHQDIETEMDVDDPIDDVPILHEPRREFTEIPMRSRDYASAFEEVTPGMYRTIGQTMSCPHVKDDPFEDEDKENATGKEMTSSTNVARCCRACFIRGGFLKHGFVGTGMKTFEPRNAEDIESDPNLDRFGIWAEDQNRLFPVTSTSNNDDTAGSAMQELTNEPNLDGSVERVWKFGPNNWYAPIPIAKKRKLTSEVRATEAAFEDPDGTSKGI